MTAKKKSENQNNHSEGGDVMGEDIQAQFEEKLKELVEIHVLL